MASLLLGACALPEREERPTIVTDRPTFSDRASLVAAGHVQIETGYTFTRRADAGVELDKHAAPEIRARYRLLEQLETHVVWNGHVVREAEQDGSVDERDGSSDVRFGVRLRLTDQNALVPQLALGATTTTGAGDDTFSTQHNVVPTVKLLWGYALPRGCTIGGNFNAAYEHDIEERERFEQLAGSVYGTTPIGERTTMFGEYYVVSPYDAVTSTAHYLGGGVLLLVCRTVQLDGRFGFGLDDDADDVFAGGGVSVLF